MPTKPDALVLDKLHQERRLVVAGHAPRRPHIDQRHRAHERPLATTRAPACRRARSPAAAADRSSAPAAPISADGRRDGSPLQSRTRNSAASARNTISGSSSSRLRRLLPELFGRGRAHRSSAALRAPRHAAFLEIAEDAPLRRIIENDPGHQSGHHEHCHRVSGDDEIGMRPEIYARICACMIRRQCSSAR